MTEPTYTDAQIEAQCTRLKQLEQMGDLFRVTHSGFRLLHDMLRQLLSERQAAMQGQGGEETTPEIFPGTHTSLSALSIQSKDNK